MEDKRTQIEAVKSFCKIQLQLLKNRRAKIRKELLDCKIQEEFLLSTLEQIGDYQSND